ncbi:hypothetical protein Tco_0438198 [Tanacetum coccineum]
MKEEALKEQTTASRPTKALTVYPPNTPATLVPRVLPTKSQVKINIFALIHLFSNFEKTYNKRITPTGLTEGERGFEQTKACYLTEVIPFFKTLKEHFEGIQKALTKEVKEMKEIFEELEAEVNQHVVDRKHDEIEWKNLLIANDNLIADCLSKEVFYVATNSELNVSSFTEMHDAHTSLKARCLELEVELSNLRDKIQKDNHDELIKRFSNLEVNHLNLQLKYQNLKESFGNNTSPPTRDVPDFDSVFVIEKIKASIQGKDNAIKKLRMQISQLNETRSEADRTLDFRTLDFQITQLTEKINVLQEQNELFGAENGKIKQHYKELYDSIKITRAKHLEQTTALLTENESLKVQIQNKLSCVNKDQVKPKVLAPGKYAIDVEPIPPRNRNNREVHLVYLKHLKESVETLREIVEEAKAERPLDRSLASACRYTKHSQELLEYVIGTCPKALNTRDNKHASTSLPKEKQVTFEEQCAMSKSNTHKPVKQLNCQKTNVPVPPSTGVNSCTDASGSQPRSNTKKNRILPAKSVNMKKVKEHPRIIKSSLKTTNRVDSSISSKRTGDNTVHYDNNVLDNNYSCNTNISNYDNEGDRGLLLGNLSRYGTGVAWTRRWLNWVLQIGISAMVIENKVKTLTITTFHFSAIKVLRATTFRNKTMSSPNRSTSDIEDAFSSMNILNYTSVSPDYFLSAHSRIQVLDYKHFPASSGSSSFNSLENSTDNMIPPVFSSFYNNPCLKDVQAFYAKESPISSPDPITSPAILTPSPVLPPSLLFDPRYFFVPEELLPPKKRICSSSSSSTTLYNSSWNQTYDLVSPSSSVYTPTPPQVFEIGKCSDKMYLKYHEKQVEDILNYLDELYLHHIEKMEEGRIDRMIIRRNSDKLKTELKKIRTQIIKLQKKRLGQKDKIAFAYYRISDLEQIHLRKIQARH